MPDQTNPTTPTVPSSVTTPPGFTQQDSSTTMPTFPTNTGTPPPNPVVVEEIPTTSEVPLTGSTEAPPTPKPPAPKGKIIAGILGILLLVGGVGAGVILTQQRQIFQQKAASENPRCMDIKSSGACSADLSCAWYACLYDSETCLTKDTPDDIACPTKSCDAHINVNTCSNSRGCKWCDTNKCVNANGICSDVPAATATPIPAATATPTSQSGTGTTGTCDTAYTDTKKQCYFDNCDGPNFCGGLDNKYTCCKAIAEYGWPTVSGCTCPSGSRLLNNVCLTYTSCTWTDTANAPPGTWCGYKQDCQSTPTPTPKSGSTPTPTPTGTAPMCIEIKALNPTSKLAVDLSSLKAGSHVLFTVKGTGDIDGAKFTITEGTKVTTVDGVKSSTGVYQYEYILVGGSLTIKVSAQLHSLAFGWF